MKKIKFLLFGFAALFVFAISMVSTNAAEVKFGSYKVTTTATENDTATWDYAGVSPATFNAGDVLTGGVVVDDTDKGSDATKGIADGLDVYCKSGVKGGTILVPVPAGSAGTFTLYTQGDQSTRFLALNNNTSDESKRVASAKGGASLTFTSADIYSVTGQGDYLSLTGYTPDNSKREVKISKMVVTLSSGAYEATPETVMVTFHDGDNILKEVEVAKGSVVDYVPTKWGYDFEGVYSDEDLTNAVSLEDPITAATSLYVKWTPWAEDTIANPNVFDLDMMSKGNDVFGAGTTGDISELEGTCFGLLGGATSFAASQKQVGDYGKSEYALKTGGALSTTQNGMIVYANWPGKLTVWARSGSSSKDVPVSILGDQELNSDPIGGTDAVKVEFKLDGGVYYVGSTGGSLYIHHITFEPSLSFHMGSGVNDEGAELVRLVMTVKNNHWTETEIAEMATAGYMNLVVKGTGLPVAGYSVMSAAVIGNSIYCNGEVYSADGVSFAQEDGTLYVAWIIAVANYGELTNQYAGVELTFELQSLESSSNPTVVYSWSYTVQAA